MFQTKTVPKAVSVGSKWKIGPRKKIIIIKTRTSWLMPREFQLCKTALTPKASALKSISGDSIFISDHSMSQRLFSTMPGV